jgi:diguanylate cyclase (GGDEF)-like protein
VKQFPSRIQREQVIHLLLGSVIPLAFVVIILYADAIEGPKTAYVGVLSAIPLFAAIFGTPRTTAFVAVVTWLSAFFFGRVASDGNLHSQRVRLVIIAIFGVVAIIAAIVRVRREQGLAQALLRAAQADLIEQQANTDLVTGLLNRRGVIASLELRQAPAMTLAMFDIDNLKQINDSYGHLVGDEVISGVGSRLAGGFSKDDVIGRWGGDEYIVILDTPMELGTKAVSRVFEQLTSEPISTSAATISVGMSVGVATWADGEAIDGVLARADDALYQAKAKGRNQVVIAPFEIVSE